MEWTGRLDDRQDLVGGAGNQGWKAAAGAVAEPRAVEAWVGGPRLSTAAGCLVSDRALRYDPFVSCAARGGDALEVGVVVEYDEASQLGGSGDHEIGDRHAMLAATGKCVLELDGSGHHLGCRRLSAARPADCGAYCPDTVASQSERLDGEAAASPRPPRRMSAAVASAPSSSRMASASSTRSSRRDSASSSARS